MRLLTKNALWGCTLRFLISHVWHNYSTHTCQRYLTKLCNNLPAALKYVGAAPEQRAALHSSCWSGFWDQPWFIVKLRGNKSILFKPQWNADPRIRIQEAKYRPKLYKNMFALKTSISIVEKKRLFKISISLNGKKNKKKMY